MNLIQTDAVARRMRSRIVDETAKRILLSRLEGSAQETDLTVPPNCGGVGRVRHFVRATPNGWPDNPLPIDPAAKALGIHAEPLMRAQVFQAAACAWRCWYCYVPFELLAGDEARSEWSSPADMVARYMKEPSPPQIIDLSGGSPDLAPEWVLWTMRALEEAGLEDHTYLWSDDNLSTDFYFNELSAADRAAIARYRNYGRVCCFKGFDAPSLSYNTSAAPAAFDAQFELFSRYLESGLDLYAYVTLTGPSLETVDEGVETLIGRLQSISPSLPLRTVPLRIQPFAPLLARRQRHDADLALEVQERAISAWTSAIESRFTPVERAKNIADITL